MKTHLPEHIATVNEAKAFLFSLAENGESFHPEDSANDIINGQTNLRLFTKQEAKKLDILMDEIYFLTSFDPCEYLLDLDKNMDMIKMLQQAHEEITAFIVNDVGIEPKDHTLGKLLDEIKQLLIAKS